MAFGLNLIALGAKFNPLTTTHDAIELTNNAAKTGIEISIESAIFALKKFENVLLPEKTPV